MSLSSSDIPWPPPFSVKKHKRAKHVKLRASRQKGLEITVPYRFNVKEIPRVLETNKNWIINKLAQYRALATPVLPTHIALPAINEEWKVNYMASHTALKLFIRQDREIVLLGKLADDKVRQLLITWLKKMARIHLANSLTLLSQQTRLVYRRLTIRDQQSRWGSCSSEKAINLNYKLLFLPKPLADHVLIHELCHTQFLDHSDKFWNLVASFDPLWKEHRLQLRRADGSMPPWL